MSEDRPVIGDFRKSQNDAPRAADAAVSNGTTPSVPTPPPAPAAAEPKPADDLAGVADAVAALKKADEEEALLLPEERYRKRLADAKVSITEASTIYDGILAKGFYEEYVRFGKSARAVFRTRRYEDSLRLQAALEHLRPQLEITQNDLITRYNLAASLTEWQGKALPHETDADFDAALALVKRLPGPVFTLLAGELAKFDYKIAVVFSEGAAQNFS